jgi:serine/threonine-protein kinase ULK/ATG1
MAGLPLPAPQAAAGSGSSKQVGAYTLTERIGTGSFATVFKAHPTLQGPDSPSSVAVKAISVQRLNKKLVEALESEIGILEKLRHPNIVQLLSHHKTRQHVYLVLEYCPGGDLHAYIRRAGPLPGRVAHHFMRELARGLEFLWSKAFVHRDLKPHNLLLTSR